MPAKCFRKSLKQKLIEIIKLLKQKNHLIKSNNMMKFALWEIK